ncbi:ABC transporter ATP-binding protein [uncultured Eubacterium sp.]|uniref:ABC transporter ATP-binding protein n=1 Tax=uncultured Eubacterium sp. TaxID=165185 RepID=UPI0025980CD0|nr:ABC transporter ATP-binding protein [uncultured Eubacterium sp.]
MDYLLTLIGVKERSSEIKLSSSFWKNNKRTFALVMFLDIVMSIITLIFAKILQEILDLNKGSVGRKELIIVSIKVIALIGICFPIYFLFSKYRAKFAATAIRQYKDLITKKIMDKGIGVFKYESDSTYVSGLTNDCMVIEEHYLLAIFEITGMVITGVGAIIVMINYSFILTIIAMVFSSCPVVYSVLTGKKIGVLEEKVSAKNANYVRIIQETLSGFPVIKSFKAEEKIIDLVVDENASLEETKQERTFTRKYVELLGGISGMITQQGVLIVGSILVLSGMNITAGMLMVFVQLLVYIISPISMLPVAFANFSAAKKLIQKMEDALSNDSKGAMVELDTNSFCTHTKGIKLENVNYSYGDEKTVLNRFSYYFEKNKSYAIVGASGSGKSTLFHLLLAEMNDYTGSILYDDNELSQINREFLYDVVSTIQQSVFVFNSSIRNNITMFGDFSRGEINRVVEMSGLSDLVALKGLDYQCGENGSNLSGGEKQRISIARALLRNSKVLLVDEATASLDAQTSSLVLNSILDIENMTRIVVTHDLDENILKRFDNIITLKNGSVYESGKFDELMAEKGYFYSLYTVSH